MNLFNKIADNFNYIDEEAESCSDLLSTVKEIEVLINKVKVRYEKYENTLKDIANFNNTVISKADLCDLAKEVIEDLT